MATYSAKRRLNHFETYEPARKRQCIYKAGKDTVLNSSNYSYFASKQEILCEITPDNLAKISSVKITGKTLQKELPHAVKYTEADLYTFKDLKEKLTKISTAKLTLQKQLPQLYSFKDVELICARLLKERSEEICKNYDQILNSKLAEQHDMFVKFTHAQITRQNQASAQIYHS